MLRRIAALAAIVVLAAPATAADLSQQAPITVRVALGSAAGALHFFPKTLVFEAGKLYKLVLENEPPQLELVINLKTARKLGVNIPPEILLEANEIIK